MIICEFAILVISKRLKLGDKISGRSSHSAFVPTGGGIIFPIATLLVFVLCRNTLYEPVPMIVMMVASVILAAVSYADDIRSLSPVKRLIVQTIVVAISFAPFLINNYYHIYILALILGVGFINAYNFMDGINGMLSAYSIVVLGSLLWAFSHSIIYLDTFVDWIPLIIVLSKVLIIATIIFGFMNFRKKALIFCGDVGSVTLGFYIAFILVTLVLTTLSAVWISFVMIYAIDTVYTILQRLFAGENILLSHRKHLYQLLVNEKGYSQVGVSLCYAGLQLIINIILFALPHHWRWSYIILSFCILTTIYIIIKQRIKVSN